MFDLIITGGTAVMPASTEAADIGVAGGKIVAIGAAGSLASVGAGRTVDAAGQIVIPGGIDPHIHCGMPIVGGPSNEPIFAAPPSQVSKAALYGGTTTMLDFALCPPDVPLRQSIEARQREWAGACYTDYGFHLMLRGTQTPELLGALPEAVQAGHATAKIFTTDIRPLNQGRMVKFGDIWEVLKIMAREGGLTTIHAEDNDIVMHMYEKLIREERTGFENMAEVHNTLSEDLSFNRVIRLAENVEGAALYMVHVSAATGVAAIAEFARPRLSDLWRDAAPVSVVHGRGLQTAGRADVPHLSEPQIRRGPEGAVGRHEPWRDPDGRDRRGVLSVEGQIAGAADRRYDRRQFRGRAAPVADVHASGDETRLFSWRILSVWCRRTRRRSWGCTRERARWRSGRTPTSCCSIPGRRG